VLKYRSFLKLKVVVDNMAKDILDVGGFTIIKRIGTGARSTIYLATDEEEGIKSCSKKSYIRKAGR